MTRDPVDVVVPFAGGAPQLAALVARLSQLTRGPGDTVLIVDNRPPAAVTPFPAAERIVRVAAPERQSSYFARNAGARAGTNPWIVFVDADVDPPADLLDAYFAVTPDERTGALVGRIVDEDVGGAFGASLDEHASLAQDHVLDREWAYAQTANCAVRRAAFAAIGGFTDTIRSGGDADLCFRLRDAGWALERRDRAVVMHEHRRTLRKLAGQKARHGAGAAWLDARWPGSMPARPARSVAAYAVRGGVAAGRLALRGRRDEAHAALVGPVADVAFHAGRRLSNDAPTGKDGWSPLARWLR